MTITTSIGNICRKAFQTTRFAFSIWSNCGRSSFFKHNLCGFDVSRCKEGIAYQRQFFYVKRPAYFLEKKTKKFFWITIIIILWIYSYLCCFFICSYNSTVSFKMRFWAVVDILSTMWADIFYRCFGLT